MFCTTIIPTVGRKTLQRAVQSVADQNFSNDEFEIIVVNDSGSPLPFEEWQSSPLVRVIDTDHRERCVARNVGAALAKGQYLHFLDDDDWLLPDALNIFWTFSQEYKDYAWLYGGTILYSRKGEPLIHLIHKLQSNCFAQVMAGEWIPLQASLINRVSFHKVGGFNPLIAGNEDIDLARKMALCFDFQGFDDVVAGVEVGQEGSTTNQVTIRSEGQWTRELIINEAGTYKRMCSSVSNHYWRGRIVRVYLTSSIWNLLRGRVLTAVSRMFYAITALLKFAFASLFSRDFWRAVTRAHESEAFSRGQEERRKIAQTVE